MTGTYDASNNLVSPSTFALWAAYCEPAKMHLLRRYRLSKNRGYQAESVGTRLLSWQQLRDDSELTRSVSITRRIKCK
jgi:hypothetical protein